MLYAPPVVSAADMKCMEPISTSLNICVCVFMVAAGNESETLLKQPQPCHVQCHASLLESWLSCQIGSHPSLSKARTSQNVGKIQWKALLYGGTLTLVNFVLQQLFGAHVQPTATHL